MKRQIPDFHSHSQDCSHHQLLPGTGTGRNSVSIIETHSHLNIISTKTVVIGGHCIRSRKSERVHIQTFEGENHIHSLYIFIISHL